MCTNFKSTGLRLSVPSCFVISTSIIHQCLYIQIYIVSVWFYSSPIPLSSCIFLSIITFLYSMAPKRVRKTNPVSTTTKRSKKNNNTVSLVTDNAPAMDATDSMEGGTQLYRNSGFGFYHKRHYIQSYSRGSLWSAK